MSREKIKLMLKRIVEAHFPARVWFPTSRGWASREPTAEDNKRRKRWAAKYLLDKLQDEKEIDK